MKKLHSLILLLAIFAYSCSYDTLPEIPKPIHYEKNPAPEPPVEEPEAGGNTEIVFSGSFGDVVATRASITDGKLGWDAGDRIMVLWKGGFNYANASAAGASAEFTTEVNEADTYWAIYPSSLEGTVGANGLSVIIPDTQYGEFDKVNIAIASTVAGSKNLVFRNLCGLGSFTLSRDDIAKVVFRGLSKETLVGNATLSISGEGIPSVSSVAAPVDSIAIVPATGESFAAGTYYFAAAPGALDAGVSFTITTNSGNTIFGKAIATPDALNRSEIHSFGTLDNMSTTDILTLRFVFGPDAGAKAIYDPETTWPETAGDTNLGEGLNYTYTIDSADYNFYIKDVSGTGKFSWRTNNKDSYADCIGMQNDKIYFGLPAIDGFRLTKAVVGQCRRGSADNAETKITAIGITNRIPDENEPQKTYVSGGELQNWPGWEGKKDKTVVDHTFELSGTEANTTYYLNSDTASIGLYFAHLVLTYEKL